MEAQIFISYSRADAIEVQQLYSKLTSLGYLCWLDVESIPSGSDWDAELQKAIESCTDVIVVCTPASMSSKNVAAEWQYAFDLKKTIHPIILKSCDVPFRLRIYQHIDATQIGIEEAIRRLIQSLPQKASANFDVSEFEAPRIAKIEALVARSYQNWRAFNILLDREGFNHIEKSREILSNLNSEEILFIYLSARHLHRTMSSESRQYWAIRVKQHPSAANVVENMIIDSISESYLYEVQFEMEMFASPGLVSKIVDIIKISDEQFDLSLLLDAAIRLLTQPVLDSDSLAELEHRLYERFVLYPQPAIARALGWINSTKMLTEVENELRRSHPKNLSEMSALHLIFLANSQTSEATKMLAQFSPDGFSLIPCGWFLMGSNEGEDYMGSPEHEVFVPSFWLRQIPITETEFELQRLLPIEEVLEAIPAHHISWIAAAKWTNVVASGTDLPLELPTEAMWEKAASWDPIDKRKRVFPWGDEVDKVRCNTIESNFRRFTPVGAFNPEGNSPYGVMDMLGNVWEWTCSKWRPYPYQPRFDRLRDEQRDLRVMRGPSQDAHRGLNHGSTTRIAFETDYAFDNSGMRVAIIIDI